ncbi:VWA domain-containing protein [Thalassotalea sp. Y01]|uniref:vWA domain-containing protein n=1 Tax=Thalassotalea sp. Y01 TaxID=2729613 RepID=UPI00145EBD3D|nr:VWA domain-containing protein [Thalassotalea sp. Y01]NMP15329.1 VWA domain-containing protein [Thalassotalea sp. Y01]
MDLYAELLRLQYFHFLRPIWLLLLLPIFWVMHSLYQRDDSLGAWRGLMSTQILEHLTVAGNNQRWFSPQRASWLVAVIITIILAGPSWTQQPSPFTEDKSALVIAIDVSETMQQSDVQPSRLVRAKQKISELLELRGDSNTALIAYSGSAHIVMPVTNDKDMISHFLDALDTNMMPITGKAPQQILPLAKALLEPTGVPGTILLIGDGANEQATTAFEDFFSSNSHQLIVWAIGDASKIDNIESGSSLIPMQLEQLQQLSSAKGGRLKMMSHDQSDIKQVNGYINNNLVIIDDQTTPWYDSGYPLVFIVAFVYLLWFRRGWTLQW